MLSSFQLSLQIFLQVLESFLCLKNAFPFHSLSLYRLYWTWCSLPPPGSRSPLWWCHSSAFPTQTALWTSAMQSTAISALSRLLCFICCDYNDPWLSCFVYRAWPLSFQTSIAVSFQQWVLFKCFCYILIYCFQIRKRLWQGLNTSYEMLGWAGWITSWNQDCLEKYHQPQICRWCHANGRKWRGIKEPLDDGERGEWKSWLETLHSQN